MGFALKDLVVYVPFHTDTKAISMSLKVGDRG